MKALHNLKYLTLLAAVGFWGCSSSLQTAQNAGEFDDLYGSSSDGSVTVAPAKEKRLANRSSTQRFDRFDPNANPDYNDQTTGQFNDDEYYSEVSARKVTRGISPDPGWNTDNAYTSGFANGYNSGMFNSSWNRWGWNTPFYGGMSLGIGLGMSPWGFNRFYSPFNYSPFGFGGGYGGYAYSPFGYGYGGGFYDSFYSPYGYGYNSFYNPYYYGGGYGRSVVVVNNYNNLGANRNATYGARGGNSRDRYNGDFVNSPRSYNNSNNGGRRSGELNSSNNNSYYSRPNNSGGNATNNGSYGAGRQNSRGSDYYYGGSNTGGRASANSANPAPSYSPPSNSDYYSAPRQNSRGSYTPPSDNSGSRYSAPQYSAPQQSRTYQAPTRSYEAPAQRSYSPPAQRSYSPPSQPSYSAPSSGGGGGGGYSGGGGGGGSRGPR